MSTDSDEKTFYWPRGVMDPLCPSGHVISESMDRRVLWHLENQLAVSATTDYLRDARRNLSRYLHTTCQHHWHEDVGYEDQHPQRQCLWCNSVEDMKS